MQEEPLSENGIIHISVGFDGPFVLQAFTVRKSQTTPSVTHLCLTDGRVYIGAKYNSDQFPEVQDYWIVRIKARFISQTHPLIIDSLQVVSTYPRKLLGEPPCTIQDYFSKETRGGQHKMGQPHKKFKTMANDTLHIPKNSETRLKPAQKQKPISFHTRNYQIKKRDQYKNKKPTNDKKNKLKIAESDDEGEELQEDRIDEEKVKKVQILDENQSIFKTCLISNLYERMTDWVILCRVNYINRVDCQNGLTANNFMISDEEGDEIKCVYFENPQFQEERNKLETGKYYSFSDGQISRGKEMQITFDKNSTIIPRNNVQFQLNLSKISRIKQISEKDSNSQVNVIGIIRNIKFQEKISKSKFKYSATISDPISNCEIDLLLFLNNNEKPPEKGAIGILHNFQLYKQNNILRLNSTYRSYFREENQYKDSLTSKFLELKNSREWDNFLYRNLSSVAFSYRTIHELRQIYKFTDDERTFSLIDCWAIDISRKKFYNACRICKKVTEKRDGNYFCPSCGKNVETLLCYTLTVNLADYTSSVVVDVIGQHAQNLLEMKALEFSQLSMDRQLQHLDSLRYKNITIKIKTERKPDKKQMHSVWAIEKSNSINTLKEIKRYITTMKVKIDDRW